MDWIYLRPLLPLEHRWYQWFFNGFWSDKPLVPLVLQWFLVQQPLMPMVLKFGNHWTQWFFNGFQWFPMVANYWSNDGMVMIHRYGLVDQ